MNRHLAFLFIVFAAFFPASKSSSAGDPVLNQLAKLNRIELERTAVTLARQAVTECVLRRRTIEPPQSLPAVFRKLRAGAFVTVTSKGQPRACMGTVAPTQSNLAHEIIHAAVNAAVNDPWQHPLQKGELKALQYTVSIIGQPQPLHGLGEFVVDRDGLMVRQGSRSAVVLPGEAKTASYALAKARRKAGLKPGEHAQLWRLPVTRLASEHLKAGSG